MKKRLIKIIIAGALFLVTLFIPNELDYLKNILCVIAYLIVGFDILKKSIQNITRGEIFDENFLMSIATIGAFLIGEFNEAIVVMLFYQIGELFQNYAVDKSRKSILSLLDIRPDYAYVYRNNKPIKVNPDEVNINEIILVKPGEKIPLDGIVTEGDSMVDTKALTGESIPRHVKVGESVLSGCINVDGVIKIKVEKEFEESTVNKILELIENATDKKSNPEKFITKFAKVYTPIVVIIAVILAFLPPLLLKNAEFNDWIYRALSFLVVSCPCALVISIPLSFFGGIGAASRLGVLVKGSNYLEKLANTDTIIFDKTGTLTEGVFEVQEIKAINISDDELLKYAAYTENYSNHPIAVAIKKAYSKKINPKLIKKVQEISGQGILANVDNKKVLIGNEKLMESYKIIYKKNIKIGTVCYVAIDNEFCGSILIADKIRTESYPTITNLKKVGIKNIYMLTGDRKNITEDVAKKLNISKYFYELLPDEKVTKMQQLLDQKNTTGNLIFVGDGINDALVLTMADIGISMGAIGSDAAIEASDIVLMTDELTKIVETIIISKKTLKIAKENILFAIAIKILILVLSALGISTMWEAVFADVGVSIIAILNALRILIFNNKHI